MRSNEIDRYNQRGVVCPPENILTTAAINNIDQNATSSTATKHFHDTPIFGIVGALIETKMHTGLVVGGRYRLLIIYIFYCYSLSLPRPASGVRRPSSGVVRRPSAVKAIVNIGEIIHVKSDGCKHKARPLYLVTEVNF